MGKIYDYYKSIFTHIKAEANVKNNGSKIFDTQNSSRVTSSNAQKIATVFSCVNTKANALAVIPIKTYKKTDKDKEEDYNSNLYNILRYEPNPNLIASLYKKMISQDLDLRGNHYSQIVRNGLGEVVALYPLAAEDRKSVV